MGPASSSIVYRAAHGVIEGRWVDEPWLAVDEGGTITALGHAGQAEPPAELLQRDLGPVMLLPGMVDAHSHAFQRAIRGATHRRGAHDPSSFWSWREAMYARAQTLDPEGVHAITRQAFAEMLRAGITCVGEFHYLHHQPDGRPYADPNELSAQVLRAAAEVLRGRRIKDGVRVTVTPSSFDVAKAAEAEGILSQMRSLESQAEQVLSQMRSLESQADTALLEARQHMEAAREQSEQAREAAAGAGGCLQEAQQMRGDYSEAFEAIRQSRERADDIIGEMQSRLQYA